MLKILRDQFKNLKWILWFVVIIFVMLIFVDWGMGRGSQRGAMEGVAAKVAGVTISETQFIKEMRSNEQRYRSMYGDQFDKLRDQIDLPTITLQNLIDRQLLMREAGRLGLAVSDTEVLEKIRSYPAFQREDGTFIGPDLYARVLRSNQMSPEEFEESLRHDLLIEKLQQAMSSGIVVSDAEVVAEYRRRNESVSADVAFVGVDRGLDRAVATDADAKAFYDAHPDRFSHPEQWKLQYLLIDSLRLRRAMAVPDTQVEEYFKSHQSEFVKDEQVRARHILIKPKADDDAGWRDAQNRVRELAVRTQLPAADFAALAREASEDTGTKGAGGDLGWFGKGRMVKEFEDAVFALREGQVSGPVKTQFGYHIIKLEGRQPSGFRTLDEVRGQIKDKLAEGLADAEGSRRATALREKIDAAKLATETQWRGLADDVITSNVTPWFGKGEAIPGLGRDPDLLAEATGSKEGFVGGPRRSSRGWVIYRVAQTRPAGTTPFDEAKDEAKDAAKRAKAVEIIRADLEAKRATLLTADLEAEAPKIGATFQKVPEHRRGSPMAGVGAADELETALFAAAPQALTPVVVIGERGVAVARVTAKKGVDDATLAKEKPALRDSMVQDQLQKLLGSMLAEAKRENPVTINNTLIDRFKRQTS
jgi:peptidyl-prolyl cis-trans isomerase D